MSNHSQQCFKTDAFLKAKETCDYYSNFFVLQNVARVKSVCIRSISGPYFPAFGPEKLRIRTLFKQYRMPLNYSRKNFMHHYFVFFQVLVDSTF